MYYNLSSSCTSSSSCYSSLNGHDAFTSPYVLSISSRVDPSDRFHGLNLNNQLFLVHQNTNCLREKKLREISHPDHRHP